MLLSEHQLQLEALEKEVGKITLLFQAKLLVRFVKVFHCQTFAPLLQ